MRRFLSLILCAAILASACPAGALAADSSRGAKPREDAPRKRDTKGMIAWAGSMLLSSVVLTIAYSEMSDYRDLGQDAEANGEDPERFYQSYDRMGWIATTAGLGVILSGVMVLKAAHGRETVEAPRKLLPPVIDWPPKPEEQAPPPPAITGTGELPGSKAIGLEAEDLVARTIREIEKTRSDSAGSDSTAPVLTQSTTTRQAWLPGTKIDTSAGKPEAKGPATAATQSTPPAAPPSVAIEKPAPVVTQKVKTQQAWLPGTTAPPESTKAVAAKAEPKPAPTPTAPPAKAGAPPAKPPSDAPKPFSLHVGSHRSLTNATRESQKWGSLGYSMHVVPTDLGEKGKWFRVFIGEFATAAEAKKFLANFQQEFPGQYAYVLKRN